MEQATMTRKLQQCEEITGYHFRDRDLCWEALNVAGSGMVASGGRLFPNGNKRLAVLGGSVLATVPCKDWYRSGQMERIWTSIVQGEASNANLYVVGTSVGFANCINLNPSNPIVISQNVMVTAIEAVIGAAFLDGGLDAVRAVMAGLTLLLYAFSWTTPGASPWATSLANSWRLLI